MQLPRKVPTKDIKGEKSGKILDEPTPIVYHTWAGFRFGIAR